MIGRIVEACLRNRLLVALAVAGLLAIGLHSFRALPMDAEPDVTSVQVQVLTNAPGLSPLEVEQLVTRPIELTMTGIPGAHTIRSISRAAVSQVTIVFDDATDLLQARELVSQRLPAAREAVPESAQRPELGPFTTALGEIFHFTLRWPGHSLRELRTLLDWEIALPLRAVPGVVEVNAWGGEVRQIEVRARASDLRALGISTAELEQALLAGGQNAGGGAIERGEEQVLLRVDGQFRTVADVANQIVATRPGGVPVFVHDVASVGEGAGFRQSVATADGRGETVYAMVQMVTGGNAHDVARDVKARLAEIEKRLPPGVVVEPFYDRAAFVDRVLHTVRGSLVEGGVIVIVVLLLLLGDLAAGIVVATTIPLAMLGAFALMRAIGLSGNLMSLGAIDFGLVVDGAVVMVEGTLAAMAARKLGARSALGEESRSVGRPIAFGVFIIGVVYLPILLLEGVEGKMFRPMALTVLFALGTALVLTFTWVPALASLLLRKTHAREPWVVRGLRRAYTPVLERLLARPWIAALRGVALVGVGVLAVIGRGAEFVPRLEEGDLVVQVTRPSSVSLPEAARGTTEIERTLLGFPEVRRVVSRTGSPDVATDVMGVDMSDVFVILRPPEPVAHRAQPRGARRRARPRAAPRPAGHDLQLDAADRDARAGAARRRQERRRHQDLRRRHRRACAASPRRSRPPPPPRAAPPTCASSRPRGCRWRRSAPIRCAWAGSASSRTRCAAPSRRCAPGASSARSSRASAASTWSCAATRRRRWRWPRSRRYPLILAGGRSVPLGDVADIHIDDGPAQISREQARRRTLVEANVRGRDLASFVRELQARIDRLGLPPGYFVRVGGQYENLGARQRPAGDRRAGDAGGDLRAAPVGLRRAARRRAHLPQRARRRLGRPRRAGAARVRAVDLRRRRHHRAVRRRHAQRRGAAVVDRSRAPRRRGGPPRRARAAAPRRSPRRWSPRSASCRWRSPPAPAPRCSARSRPWSSAAS